MEWTKEDAQQLRAICADLRRALAPYLAENPIDHDGVLILLACFAPGFYATAPYTKASEFESLPLEVVATGLGSPIEGLPFFDAELNPEEILEKLAKALAGLFPIRAQYEAQFIEAALALLEYEPDVNEWLTAAEEQYYVEEEISLTEGLLRVGYLLYEYLIEDDNIESTIIDVYFKKLGVDAKDYPLSEPLEEEEEAEAESLFSSKDIEMFVRNLHQANAKIHKIDLNNPPDLSEIANLFNGKKQPAVQPERFERENDFPVADDDKYVSAIDSLQRYLKALDHELRPAQNEDEDGFWFDDVFVGGNITIGAFIQFDIIFVLLIDVPVKFPAKMTPIVSEYLHRANAELTEGHFELNYDTLGVRYRASVYFGLEALWGEAVENAIQEGVAALNQFYPGLEPLLAGKLKPKEAVEWSLAQYDADDMYYDQDEEDEEEADFTYELEHPN